MISGAKEFLETAISDNRTQIEALGKVSSQFQAAGDPRPIIEKLVKELSNATTRASSLETNFLKTSEELDKIRQLAEAGGAAFEHRCPYGTRQQTLI